MKSLKVQIDLNLHVHLYAARIVNTNECVTTISYTIPNPSHIQRDEKSSSIYKCGENVKRYVRLAL